MNARKDREIVRDLAWFRYNLRRFLRFSEKAARACGVTPQQHQLMLGVAGFTQDGAATISELAEFLQERNHSVVGLVDRAVNSGLVRRQSGAVDRREVIVSLTPYGEEVLARLSRLHREEAQRAREGFLTLRSLQKQRSAGAGAVEQDGGRRERDRKGPPPSAAKRAAIRAPKRAPKRSWQQGERVAGTRAGRGAGGESKSTHED